MPAKLSQWHFPVAIVPTGVVHVFGLHNKLIRKLDAHGNV